MKYIIFEPCMQGLSYVGLLQLFNYHTFVFFNLTKKHVRCALIKNHDVYCQALSISQSLNLSLSLRDRDRADTIITFHHHHQNLFKHLEGN